MESWQSLPDDPLEHPPEPTGVLSATLVDAGCASYRAAARHLHDLPYGRNSDRANYRLVLEEGRGTCSTKHALLAAVAREQNLPVSLTIGIFDMSEANTPGVGKVLAPHTLPAIPEAHCYLTYRGRRVDVTRSGLTAAEPIARFHREWTIEPHQIGDHKLQLHERFLREWLSNQPKPQRSFEELWRIREACIAALGSSAPDR